MNYRLLVVYILIVSQLSVMHGMKKDAKEIRRVTLQEVCKAILSDDVSVVEDYVEGGGKFDGVEALGVRLMHRATKSGATSVLMYLVRKVVNIGAQGFDGKHPIHYGAERGYLEVVKWLVGRGADIEAEKMYVQKPIYCAAINGRVEVLKFLIEYGAKIDISETCDWKKEVVTLLAGCGVPVSSKDSYRRLRTLLGREFLEFDSIPFILINIAVPGLTGYSKIWSKIWEPSVEDIFRMAAGQGNDKLVAYIIEHGSLQSGFYWRINSGA